MSRQIIATTAAPQAIGTYSQAVKIGQTVYLSGQIALNPVDMTLNNADMGTEINQVFQNLKAVAQASGGDLADIAKLSIFLTDLSHFALVNEIMSRYFCLPYPARAVVGVASLPKNARVEMDAIMVLAS
jgi:reactive intermediate/imine deaminase